MKWLREKIESIVFAGLKPGGGQAPAAAPPPDTWMGRLRQRIDAWISGGPAPSDPLYLSRRSTGQKVRAWSVVAIPVVILLGGVGLTLGPNLNPPEAKPMKDPSAAEVAAKMLPNLGDLKIPANSSIDVIEVRVERAGGVRITGVLKNRTDHEIAMADITCDLTDPGGTQLGSVSVRVEKISAASTRRFELPLKQPNAAFVLVREISTR